MIGYGLLAFIIVVLAVSNLQYRISTRSALKRVRRALEDRKDMVRFLDRFSRSIVTSRDEKKWMQSMADLLCDSIKAKNIRLYIFEQQHHFRLVAETGKLPPINDKDPSPPTEAKSILEALHQEQIEVSKGIFHKAVSSGKSVHKDFPADDNGYRRKGLRSIIAVPMILDGQKIGLICALDKKKKGNYFTSEDVDLLECLSNQIALAGTLFKIYEDIGEQHRIQRELSLAREIQNSLLPKEAPKSENFAIHGVNIAAKEVSGDLYDFVPINDNFLLVLIADASGKGVPACMIMSMCRIFVRANAARYKDNLEGLLKELNQNLYIDTDEARFVTLACCLIDKRDNTVEYARAGHTELLIQQPAGDVQIIYPDGPALGLLPPDDGSVQFDTFSFSWLPNSSIVLFTDGIIEALDEDGEEYGLDRLIDSLTPPTCDPEATATRVVNSVRDFVASQPQMDDQTLVILTRTDHSTEQT